MLMIDTKSIEKAYLFAMAWIIFGLPLGISYYPVQSSWRLGVLFALFYTLIGLLITLVVLFRSGKGEQVLTELPNDGRSMGDHLAYLSLLFGTLAVICYGLMKYSLLRSYPYPSSSANLYGGFYILLLALTASIGIPWLLARGINIVRIALSSKYYFRVALLSGIAYFLTYEILVNEILITGYNAAPGDIVPSPTGHYPWVYVFTVGPSPINSFESFVYIPYVLIQINKEFNFFFIPVELLFAILLSSLMGSGIAVVLYSIKRSNAIGSACRRGAALSALGGFVGYTATCPSCLAPTLISAILGGFSLAQSIYSNIYGVLIPPFISFLALVTNLIILNRMVGARKDDLSTKKLQI